MVQVEVKPDSNCVSILTDFFFQNGGINYFYIEDWNMVNEFRHIVGIKDIFPDSSGTRVIFIDNKSDGFVYKVD